MRRPKAIADGRATSMAASPPQISPVRCAPPGAVDGTGVVTAGILGLRGGYCKRCQEGLFRAAGLVVRFERFDEIVHEFRLQVRRMVEIGDRRVLLLQAQAGLPAGYVE